MEEVAACLWFVIYGLVSLCYVSRGLILLSRPRPSGQKPPKLFPVGFGACSRHPKFPLLIAVEAMWLGRWVEGPREGHGQAYKGTL